MKLLRIAPLTAALFLVLHAPDLHADPCASVCASESTECRRDCEGDTSCLKECDESKKLCPDLCKAMMRGNGDKKAIEREVMKVIEREEQRQAEAAKAADAAQEHEHRKHERVQKDNVK